MIGGFTIEADGALLLFMDGGKIVRWCEGHEQVILDGIAREHGSRFNDVIADAAGRVFCGTMSTDSQQGQLYRLDSDCSLHTIARDIKCSNGLAFSPDGINLFLTDSLAHVIYIFDYDLTTGGAVNQRVFLQMDPELGCPDGLTIDSEGFFWSALWDGGCIIRYARDGQHTLRLRIPARKAASLTFGGRDLDTLFVVSAGGEARVNEGEYAGALFATQTGIRGVPEFRSRICCSGLPVGS
jgi:D-xylonolactonase